MTTLTLTNDDAEWVEALIEQRNTYGQALQKIISICWDDYKNPMDSLVEISNLAGDTLKNNPDPIAPTVA